MDKTATNHHKNTPPFPMLKPSAIVAFISEMEMDTEMNLTEDVLNDPIHHKDKVKNVLRQLVEPSLGISLDDPNSISKTIIDHKNSVPHPELHEESILEMNFFEATKKFMSICGVRDFSLRDLYAPTPKRLRKQLSGAINFIKFREDKLRMYDEINEERLELIDGLSEVNEENATLNKQLEENNAACSHQWKEIEDIKNECEEIKNEIAQQNKLQASIRHESGQLKKTVYELKEANAITALALQEEQADERKLSSRLVQSPERIKREVSEAKKSLDTEKRALQKAEVDAENARSKSHKVAQTIKDVTVAHRKIVNEVEVEISRHTELLESMDSIKENIAVNKNSFNAANATNDELKRKIVQITEMTAQLHQKSNDIASEAQKDRNRAQERQMALEKEKHDCAARVEASMSRNHHLVEDIKVEKQKVQEDITEMIRAFKHIENAVIESDKAVRVALDQ